MSGEQAIFNLEIKKKSGLSLNPDIHHSKVFSSGYTQYSPGCKYISIRLFSSDTLQGEVIPTGY